MPGSIFTFPGQRGEFARAYWTVTEAAMQWRCSYKAARNYIARNPDVADRVLIISKRGSSWRWAVPVGTVRPVKRRGNPMFRYSDYQRNIAVIRWENQRRQRIFTPSHASAGAPVPGQASTAFGVYHNGKPIGGIFR